MEAEYRLGTCFSLVPSRGSYSSPGQASAFSCCTCGSSRFPIEHESLGELNRPDLEASNAPLFVVITHFLMALVFSVT